MKIIHWIVTMLEGMDLFENPLNNTPKFILSNEPIIAPQEQPVEIIDLTCDENVTEAILPRAAVERAHLDVYDASGPLNVVPYRLTSRAYDLDSQEYHHSVYLNIKGEYAKHIDLNSIDLQTLYEVRKENMWKGVNSLYHAWLLVNFR